MFEKLQTPEEIFSFKLGSALKMEQDLLKVLGDLQAKTNRSQIRDALARHAEETKQHVTNIEECFRLLGEEPDDSPNPTTKGLAGEGKSTMKKTDDELVDAIVMAAVIESEHYEMAVYEVLIPNAIARGAEDVARLLRENYDDEVRTLHEAKELAGTLAQDGWRVAA